MFTTKEIDNIRKRIEAAESYLNIGSWREVTTTLAADNQAIADAANRIDTVLDRYKAIIEDISNNVIIPGKVLEVIERDDFLSNPFGLSVCDIVDCAYREDVAELLKGGTDWGKVNPDRKKMIGVISKLASVDLSRTENPWPIVMQSGSKYYSTPNIQKCIALYWQKMPLFRLCSALIKCGVEKNTALTIAYYAKVVSLYRQTDDFKQAISPFMNRSMVSDCSDGQNTADCRVKSTELSSMAIEPSAVESTENEQESEDEHKENDINEAKSDSSDKDILKRNLIERFERLYCPFKNGFPSANMVDKLSMSLSSKETVKIINLCVDFRKCEKGMKKDIYEILYEFGLYRLTYSNFCKHTD